MNVLADFKKIKAFIFDMDGVLTDGMLLLLDDGQMARSMNIKDGYALQLAIKRGYFVLILSGAVSNAAKIRLQKLGLSDIFMNIADKKALLEEFMKKHLLTREQVLYMGDDIPDLLPMLMVGLPCCPSDAAQEIKNISRYISAIKGGYGCVRDVIEKVLTLNGHWAMDISVVSK